MAGKCGKNGKSHREGMALAKPSQNRVQIQSPLAQVVKLVDALASGASPRKGVKVRVLSWAPLFFVLSCTE
jgi:hypothetical protein